MPKLQTQPDALWRSVKNWRDAELASRYEDQLLLVLTLLLGAIIGLVVVAFILVTENLGARMYPAGGDAWRRFIIPVAGSAVAGLLLYRYFPNARGSGIPQTKTAMFIGDGVITFRTAVGKFLCSGISLGTGIALGREGPSVHVAAGIASSLGRRLGLSPRRVKALVPIGSAAALAAAFNTPIAAVLFTLEEVMGDLHAPVLGSIVISSATSWMVLHLMLGDEPLFHVPPYQVVHPIEFAFYALLGVIGGLVSVAFVKLLLWQRKHFLRMPAFTRWFQPVAGGLTVGILGWFVPQVLGVGYGFVSLALNGQMVLSMMALLVVLKIVATSTCYASGNAGGIFGPSLFIGAMIGGSVGGAAHSLLPKITANPGAYALVGMGTAFAGIVRTPLTSVIMIFEMTRDYAIIVPLMISNLISFFISRRLQPEPIYEALALQEGVYLPTVEEHEDVAGMHVGEILDRNVEMLPVGATLEQAASFLRKRGCNSWPVGEAASLLGVVTLHQLETAPPGAKTVRDLLPPGSDFPHLHVDHAASRVLDRMRGRGVDAMPVVSRADIHELLGVVTLTRVLTAYGIHTEGEKAVLS